MKLESKVWFVYLLECSNGKLYTGITLDLAKRFSQHSTGKGAMFTRLNRPERMIAAQPCENRSEASKLEWRIKGLTAVQKRLLVETWSLTAGLPGHSPEAAGQAEGGE
ncbi:MAG: GIY-YIG nuclease family protein [Methylococcales bacterium]|nr:GIY-YIG nuclease family protein [Methylococcales bacterium]